MCRRQGLPPWEAQPIPLDVVYEDADIIVVNKPKGMVVHPAAGNPDGTLVNALLHHCCGQLSGINGEERPGIVHRIDKDTSGLLVAAKTNEAHVGLCEQFAVHSITRVYQAVVYGGFSEDDGAVEGLIGRSPKDRKKDGRSGEERKVCIHFLSCRAAFFRLYPHFCTPENGAHTPDTRAYGKHWPPVGR